MKIDRKSISKFCQKFLPQNLSRLFRHIYNNVRINLYRMTEIWQLERQDWPFELPKKDISWSARDRRLSSWCLEVTMHFMVYMHFLAFFLLRTGFVVTSRRNTLWCIYLLLHISSVLSSVIVSNVYINRCEMTDVPITLVNSNICVIHDLIINMKDIHSNFITISFLHLSVLISSFFNNVLRNLYHSVLVLQIFAAFWLHNTYIKNNAAM